MRAFAANSKKITTELIDINEVLLEFNQYITEYYKQLSDTWSVAQKKVNLKAPDIPQDVEQIEAFKRIWIDIFDNDFTQLFDSGKFGDNYVGQFKDGEFSGQGTYAWVTKDKKGAKYVGRFKNDKYHGQGTYIFADGAKYVGRFKDGKFHGQGTYTGADGRRYVGEWKDDKFHGRGTFNYPDGRVEEGIWKYGRLVE